MIEKPKRIKDLKAIKKIRDQAKGFCEYCGVFKPPLHIHHIRSKGSGGSDTPDNLIALCFVCHHMAHNVSISKDRLRRIANDRIYEA
jgi:5-methylcytosine-specific restriction endonuclease McrA